MKSTRAPVTTIMPSWTEKYVETIVTSDCPGPGWVLLAIVNVEELLDRQIQIPNPHPQSGFPSFAVTRHYKVSHQRFVYGRTKYDALQAMQASIEKSQERGINADQLAGAATAEKNTALAALQKCETRLAVESRSHTETNAELKKAHARNSTYEQDIAKLRGALGELRMKEILGK